MRSILIARPYALAIVGVPLLLVLLIGLARWPADGKGQAPKLDMNDWDVPRLAEHLRSGGLRLRTVGARADGALMQGCFFTTTNLGWAELNSLHKTRERVEHWRGTVSCERRQALGQRDDALSMWGECCLVIGPFVFFGDPALLQQIRATLC